MAAITEDSMGNEGYYLCWMEAKNGKSEVNRKQYDQYLIAVINNRYGLMENQEEGYENISLDREHQ
jgi:hypothetical protein